MVDRPGHRAALNAALKRALGARQVGKSTLARELRPQHYYDLENARDVARLTDPVGELDLLVVRGRARLGFEMKLSSSPVLTPSMRIAVEDLHLDELVVLHRGVHSYRLAPKVRAVPARELVEEHWRAS